MSILIYIDTDGELQISYPATNAGDIVWMLKERGITKIRLIHLTPQEEDVSKI